MSITSGDDCISLCTAVSTEVTHWFLNLQAHDFTSALSQDCIRRELLALQGPSCSVPPVQPFPAGTSALQLQGEPG